MNCEFSDHPWFPVPVRLVAAAFVRSLAADPTRAEAFLTDPRTLHRAMFAEVAPDGHQEFAGNYRGSDHEALVGYGVTFGERKGVAPHQVAAAMKEFSESATKALRYLDRLIAAHGARSTVVANAAVAVAVRLFWRFLRIHPFADGNGHTARAINLAVLKYAGFDAPTFSIDPRPPGPEYIEGLRRADHGDFSHLEAWMRSLIK